MKLADAVCPNCGAGLCEGDIIDSWTTGLMLKNEHECSECGEGFVCAYELKSVTVLSGVTGSEGKDDD